MSKQLFEDAVELLKKLIATPSFSREENETATLIEYFFAQKNIPTHRKGNNIWAKNRFFNENLPTVLLNSHHDTVKPVSGWSRDPFSPDVVQGKLYGLGSNDAGGALVSLIATFLYFWNNKNIKYNIVIAATAEEEISGANGIASLLPDLPPPSVGIVGEPTLTQMAVAEKGLMVIDAVAKGKAGHAARQEGINALYIALNDIQRIKDFKFDKVSNLLGEVRATVTQIEAGTQHNVVPDRCRFVIDVRANECYTNEEILNILQQQTQSELKARSLRLQSSRIDLAHPLVLSGMRLGLTAYGSPTLSDQALMPFTTLKMGPGDSARSHTANEYINLDEIEEGINMYIAILEGFILK